MTQPETVDSYVANASKEARPVLEELREIIRSTIPEADEGIEYNVPFYRFHGDHVGFTEFKNHATFGIGADALQSEDRQSLEKKGYQTGKETIQITYDQEIPTEEITQLLKIKRDTAKRAEE